MTQIKIIVVTYLLASQQPSPPKMRKPSSHPPSAMYSLRMLAIDCAISKTSMESFLYESTLFSSQTLVDLSSPPLLPNFYIALAP